MTQKPPGEGSQLEIDDAGHDEFLAREANEARARAASAEKTVRKHLENQRLTVAAIADQARASADWRRRFWRGLVFMFYFLLAYFISTAFFDFVGFMIGVRVLQNQLFQLAVLAPLFFLFRWWQLRQTEEEIDRYLDRATKPAQILGILVLAYGAFRAFQSFAPMAGYKSSSGMVWNKPFLGLLFFLIFGFAGLIFLRLRVRRIMEKICYEKLEFFLELPQLRLIQYACEGMLINLTIAVFFLWNRIDVPRLLANSVSRPSYFLIIFLPFFTYVFFRKYFEGFYSD